LKSQKSFREFCYTRTVGAAATGRLLETMLLFLVSTQLPNTLCGYFKVAEKAAWFFLNRFVVPPSVCALLLGKTTGAPTFPASFHREVFRASDEAASCLVAGPMRSWVSSAATSSFHWYVAMTFQFSYSPEKLSAQKTRITF
jgi:hypothetical protein